MTPIAPKTGKKYSLEQLQELVGGCIELLQLDASTVLVCDEEGKLKGYEPNGLATMIFRDSHRFRNTKDFIVGNVLICNTKEID